MTTVTFKKLSVQRQNKILDVAFEEFALNGYRSASLSEIVKKLGLAKGSFYRYFKSKKELYAYLVDVAVARRMKNLSGLVGKPEMDFFELIRQNFIDKLRFDIEHPVIGGFLFRILHESDTSEVFEIVTSLKNRIIQQTKLLITSEKFKDTLAGYDPTLMAFQVFHMQLWLYEYVAFTFHVDFDQNVKQLKPVLSISETELGATIDQCVAMLKKGIQKEADR